MCKENKVMTKESYHCKYCKKPMNKVEYELFNGYCLKCKDLHDWKQILSEQKKPSTKQ